MATALPEPRVHGLWTSAGALRVARLALGKVRKCEHPRIPAMRQSSILCFARCCPRGAANSTLTTFPMQTLTPRSRMLNVGPTRGADAESMLSATMHLPPNRRFGLSSQSMAGVGAKPSAPRDSSSSRSNSGPETTVLLSVTVQ